MVLSEVEIFRQFSWYYYAINNYSLKKHSWQLKGPGFLCLRENPYKEEISINEKDSNVYLEKWGGDTPDVVRKYYYEEINVTSRMFL